MGRPEGYRPHEFNLLGSGWVKVLHGVKCAGLEGSSSGGWGHGGFGGPLADRRINEMNLPSPDGFGV